MRLTFLVLLMMGSTGVFGAEVFDHSAVCKGPFKMLPEVYKTYPVNSITLTLTYDKLFKNHDVTIDMGMGIKTTRVLGFVGRRDGQVFPPNCYYSADGIFIDFDCETKEIQAASLPVANGNRLHMNCKL